MVELIHLSPELLLCVASYFTQVDLLNISLTCRHLRDVTEPELYRVYSNPCLYRRSFAPFLNRLVERPKLTKYVHRLELKIWQTLDYFNPEYHEDDGIACFVKHLPPQPSEVDYHLITQAAKSVGVINSIYPYEASSTLVQRAKVRIARGSNANELWYKHIYDDDISIDDIPYDRKFCQLLRAGIEDPYVALMVALLPNVREIFLHGAPRDRNTLTWKAPHNFEALRRLGGRASDEELEWPAAVFNNVLQAGKLEVFETFGAGSWWRDTDLPGLPGTKVSFTLRPKTLNLTHIVLQYSTLALSEMGDLINACRQLKSFYFSSGDEWITEKPSPAKIIDLLWAHKDCLEELYLDIAYYGAEAQEKESIKSLVDFTRLCVLDTMPHNWFQLTQEDLPDSLEDCDRLCNRLPPNVTNVIFHQGETISDVSARQIGALFGMRERYLLKLQDLTIETTSSNHKKTLADLWQIARKRGPVLFNFHPVIAEARVLGTQTIFDDIPHPREFLLTKWTGSTYTHQTPVKPAMLVALEKYLEDFPEDVNFTGIDLRALPLHTAGYPADDDDSEGAWEDADSDSDDNDEWMPLA